MCTIRLTVEITMSIITEIGVKRKPKVNSSCTPLIVPKSSHVKSNGVITGYIPVAASRPATRKYSIAV